MTKSKSTKKALLSSVLALVLTCAMLIGTTFAWFTDSVKSGKNKIVAGNLDVELEYSTDLTNWKPVNGATDLFNPDALWEPGHAEIVYLKVKNAGTLALKYNFNMNIASQTIATNVANEKFKLSDYLKYGFAPNVDAVYADRGDAIAAVAATAVPFTQFSSFDRSDVALKPNQYEQVAVVVYMPETVGNEANYRGDVIPTIDFGLTLTATQYTFEKDSWDDQYDVGAEYPQPVSVTANDVATYDSAISNLKAGTPTTVTLSSDLAGTTGVFAKPNSDLTMDFNGNSASASTPVGSAGTVSQGMHLEKDSTVVLKNGTFTPGDDSVHMLVQNYANLTLDNFTLDASASSLVSYVLSNNNGDVLITGASNILAADGKIALDAYYWPKQGYTGGVRVVIDENATGLIKGEIEFTDDGTDTTGAADPAKHSIVIKGGYFTEDPSAYVPAGYKVIASNRAFEINGNAYAANYQVVRDTDEFTA